MSNTIKIECESCNGTGLYVGMCERDGAAVVCNMCEGTGCEEFTYTEFTSRKLREGVKRVYRSCGGRVITAEDVKRDDGTIAPYSQAGCSYDKWLDGEQPKHIEFNECPMLTSQGDCHDIKLPDDWCNKKHGGYVSFLPSCKYQPNKAKCWVEFNKREAEKVSNENE